MKLSPVFFLSFSYLLVSSKFFCSLAVESSSPIRQKGQIETEEGNLTTLRERRRTVSGVGAILPNGAMSTPTMCQFHQRFSHVFFVQTLIRQFFFMLRYVYVEKAAETTCVWKKRAKKLWWNWQNVSISSTFYLPTFL